MMYNLSTIGILFFTRVREYGLTLKLSKCRFLLTEVDFLGHQISLEGIRPGKEKIICVENFPQPNNVHEIRQFIGLASCFRKFVPKFAEIAEPLTRLTRKMIKFEWTDEQQKAFDNLKHKLCERDVLTIFDNKKDHEVHTDASSIGIAGVLLQRENDNSLHPVAYYSRKTTDVERKFHSYELESLAVVESLDRFRPYILGKFLIVVTDCGSLKTASTKRDIIPRIGRWWLKLSEFDFEIRHRSGKQMLHVDALSRNPQLPSVEMEPACLDIFQVESVDRSWVEVLQENDPEVIKIKENIKDKKYMDFVIENGKLYRKIVDKLLFFVPKGIRGRIVRSSHDDMGHYGLEKTLSSIRVVYWWPRMRQFVKKYINTCLECLFHKENRDASRVSLHPIDKVPSPCHTWHMDHLGPFVKSSKGNAYILVTVDSFTKYVFIKAVKDTSSRFVVNAIKDMSAHFGVPFRIITDRGSAFTSKNFEHFCTKHAIKHILNASSTPRANGQVERYNRTILHALRTMCDNDQRKWEDHLPAIQWSLNSSQHSITKKSPQELLFGFTPKYINEEKLKLTLLDESANYEVFVDHRPAIRDEADKNIKKNQENQKERFQINHKPPREYKIGDNVVIFREPPSTGESRKLLRKFRGPYKVTEILYGDRYRVEDKVASDGRRRFRGVLPADHMRLVHVPEEELTADEETYSDND